MARWRLSEPHYLNVPGGKWEQKEIDRATGKLAVKTYAVPTHLDAKIEDDWNYTDKRPDPDLDDNNSTGIIVCHEGKGKPRDIVFVGHPTPGMIPLDAEARELSSKLSKVLGFDPFAASLDDNATYSNHVLNKAAALFGEASAKSSESNGEIVSMQKQLNETMAMMASLMAENQKLLAQVVSSRRL